MIECQRDEAGAQNEQLDLYSSSCFHYRSFANCRFSSPPIWDPKPPFGTVLSLTLTFFLGLILPIEEYYLGIMCFVVQF